MSEKRTYRKFTAKQKAEIVLALGRKTYELEIAGEALRGWE